MTETTQYASQAMETGTARQYEISFLVRSEEDVQGVAKLLSAHGAQVTDEGQVRKLNLAYPIKHVTDGYFGFLKATLTAEAVKTLENAARTDKSVLRLLILAESPVKEPKASAKKAAAPRRERTEKPAPAATNEDLEKAIEELAS
jgi:ribosomal protein S6